MNKLIVITTNNIKKKYYKPQISTDFENILQTHASQVMRQHIKKQPHYSRQNILKNTNYLKKNWSDS